MGYQEIQSGFGVNYIWIISIIFVLSLIITMVIINMRKNSDKISLIENYKNIIGMFFVVTGGFSIIVYPIVLIANAMSTIGFFEIFTSKSIDEFISGIVMILVILLSTSYPGIYIICTIAYFKKKGRKRFIFQLY